MASAGSAEQSQRCAKALQAFQLAICGRTIDAVLIGAILCSCPLTGVYFALCSHENRFIPPY